MDVQEKILKLHSLTESLRVTLASMGNIFETNYTVEHCIWKINKQISALQREICLALEKELTNEDFNKIVKNLEQDLGDSK